MATSFQVTVEPKVLKWAIQRSQRSDLNNKFKNLSDWLTSKKSPTFKQLEQFAKAVYVPLPLLLGDEPLEEPDPITDFRTIGNKENKQYSGNLLDVIYDCQRKQTWYRGYCQQYGEAKNEFVGRYQLQDDPVTVAATIRSYFKLEKALSFRGRKAKLEEQGILVITSGIVGSNTHRPLDVEEFRGFALGDDYAPVIFINAKDYEHARSFTLIHELAHLALGNSGVSKPLSSSFQGREEETWCNRVAAEVLVPADSIRESYRGKIDYGELDWLADDYNVSRLVILIRLKDLGLINEKDYENYYDELLQQYKKFPEQQGKKSGGNYYNTKPAQVSQRFLRALAVSTLEGDTLYRDAMALANVKTLSSFDRLVDTVLN